MQSRTHCAATAHTLCCNSSGVDECMLGETVMWPRHEAFHTHATHTRVAGTADSCVDMLLRESVL